MDGPAKKAPAYNLNNPAVKRLLKEYRELQKEGSDQFTAAPLEEDIFEFHFTIRGPSGTDFEGGIYHGRILLPQEYPMKPPDFVFLTPNGRFEVGKKICLTVTSYHSESWQPSWSIRTALLAIIGFMPTKAEGAIGGLDYPADERKKLAAQSTTWRCDKCGVHCARALPDAPTPQPSLSSSANSLAASADDLRTSGPALRVSQVSYTIPQSPPQPGSPTPTAPAAPPVTPAAAAAPTAQPSLSAAAAVTPPPRPASPVPSAARLPGAAAVPPAAQLAVAPQRQESKFLDTAIGFLIAMIIALLWHKYRGV